MVFQTQEAVNLVHVELSDGELFLLLAEVSALLPLAKRFDSKLFEVSITSVGIFSSNVIPLVLLLQRFISMKKKEKKRLCKGNTIKRHKGKETFECSDEANFVFIAFAHIAVFSLSFQLRLGAYRKSSGTSHLCPLVSIQTTGQVIPQQHGS